MAREQSQIFGSIVLLFIVMMTTSCSTFVNRTIDKCGVETKYIYAYGKFCGPGYPKKSDEKRDKQLVSLWEPMDDLDAMCYAHDMCYAIYGENDKVCDRAISEVSNNSARHFKRGCAYTSFDIAHAFLAKPEKAEKFPWYAKPLFWIIEGFKAVSAAIIQVTQQPLDLFTPDPKEGTCFLGDQANVVAMIQKFEVEFDKHRCKHGNKAEDRARFEVPYPGRPKLPPQADPCDSK